MNEQVYSLAEQASGYAVMNPSDEVLQSETEDAKVEIPKAFIDKFAELIVRECSKIAEEYDGTKLSGPGMIIAARIKTHFGVEE